MHNPLIGRQLTGLLPAWLLLALCMCDQVTRAVFEASKGRLKVVGRAGVGVDNVDLTAATEVSYIFFK
jgi:phosphoglycerate dehydrogenase-like enzyme